MDWGAGGGGGQDPGVWLGLISHPLPAPGIAWELGCQTCHSPPSPLWGVTAQDREGTDGQERLVKGDPGSPWWPFSCTGWAVGGEMGRVVGPAIPVVVLGTLSCRDQ